VEELNFLAELIKMISSFSGTISNGRAVLMFTDYEK